jgi:hypothetical protein
MTFRKETIDKKIGIARKFHFGIFIILLMISLCSVLKVENNNDLIKLKSAYKSLKYSITHFCFVLPAFVACVTSFLFQEKFKKIYKNTIWIIDFTNQNFISKAQFTKMIIRIILSIVLIYGSAFIISKMRKSQDDSFKKIE